MTAGGDNQAPLNPEYRRLNESTMKWEGGDNQARERIRDLSTLDSWELAAIVAELEQRSAALEAVEARVVELEHDLTNTRVALKARVVELERELERIADDPARAFSIRERGVLVRDVEQEKPPEIADWQSSEGDVWDVEQGPGG